MGKSFILKDQFEKPAGYLLQGLRTLRCRFSGAEEGMESVLFYADGQYETKKLAPVQEEMEWEKAGSELVGAVIVKDGMIAASSNVQARERFKDLQAARQRVNCEKRLEAPADMQPEKVRVTVQEEGSERKLPKRLKEESIGLPECRWPRPPCWKGAVYEYGRWTEAEESKK